MVIVLSVANIASADVFDAGGANEFTIDFVNISGDTNPASGIPLGGGFTFMGVNNDYRMGTSEITNDQWDKFSANLGVPVTGSPSEAYEGSAQWTGTNVPTNFLSWYEAAQFVNWLNTSTDHQAAYKFTGTQGTDDYTFDVWESGDAGYDSTNPYRNSNAYYFLPTDDEWVKAAYWNGTSLQACANASPGDLVSGSPDPAKWNYDPSAGDEPWDVGSGSEELNGTFDMMGNMWEWMENPWSSGDYLSGSSRGIRGGSWNNSGGALKSSFRGHEFLPSFAARHTTFRVASVPEPTTLLLLGLGGLMLRRKR